MIVTIDRREIVSGWARWGWRCETGSRPGAHSRRRMLALILFSFNSYCVKQNKLLIIFIIVPHTSISEGRSEVWDLSGTGPPPPAALSRGRAIFQSCAWPPSQVPSQLLLYTIREGTVRYSPFSKELSNCELIFSSLSERGWDYFCEAISICEWKTSAGSADGSGVWSLVLFFGLLYIFNIYERLKVWAFLLHIRRHSYSAVLQWTTLQVDACVSAFGLNG